MMTDTGAWAQCLHGATVREPSAELPGCASLRRPSNRTQLTTTHRYTVQSEPDGMLEAGCRWQVRA